VRSATAGVDGGQRRRALRESPASNVGGDGVDCGERRLRAAAFSR
jgi:hypothetical protein